MPILHLNKVFNKRDKVRNLSATRGRGRLYTKEWPSDWLCTFIKNIKHEKAIEQNIWNTEKKN